MKNDTAQVVAEVRKATERQMKDLCALGVLAIPTGLSFEVADDALSRKTEFIEHVRAFFPNPADLADPRKVWENFYWKYFSLTVDLSGVKIPERTPEQAKEFTRLIIVAQGLSNNQAYNACFGAFNGKCYKYTDDLDKGVPANERDPKGGSYAIWVRDTVEADEVHKNKSANMIVAAKLKTETLLERMLHELKYFAETGKHLDMNNVTLCSGSRDSDGSVPDAIWSDGGFQVDWGDSDDQDKSFRSREVVS